MRYLLLMLFPLVSFASFPLGFQNEDFKTCAQLVANSQTCDHLLNASSVWDNINSQLLSTTISTIVPATGTGWAVSTITSSSALTAGSPHLNQQHIACNAAGGSVIATLPLCVTGIVGQVFNLKKIDSSANPCQYSANGSDLIDGAATISILDQYVGISVACRAAGFWDIL